MSEQRVNIIPSGKRAADERGVNQWTGDPLPTPKKLPIKALLVPEHHWADGVVHAGVHPGTNNVAPTADAAWYERAAVHRALEDRAPGQVFTHQDVSQHVQMIKKMLATPSARGMLGKSADDYEAAARVLPQLVPQSAGLLRSSGQSSRPGGNVADRMTHVAGPLVRVANELLHRAGVARKLEPQAAPSPSSVVSEEPRGFSDTTGGEVTPTIKPAGDEAPIKVANAPGELGKTGHRWNAIRELAKSGASREQIIAHLRKVFFLPQRTAADTLRRWARAESAVQSMNREGAPAAGGPTRLARPGANVLETQLSPKHLTGTSHEFQKGGLGTGGQQPEKSAPTTRVKIDPQIEGTSLAYHLRQIAQEFGHPTDRYNPPRNLHPNKTYSDMETASLADHVLSGTSPKGFNGDPYAALGRKLRDVGHPLARAYNWQRMSEALARDKFIEDSIGKYAKQWQKEGVNDSTHWDNIHRAMRDRTEWGMQLWRHVANEAKALGPKTYLFDTAGKRTAASFLDSIHRISDRHLDRDYLKAVQADKGRGESHDESSPLYWRDVMEKNRHETRGASPNNKYKKPLKFFRFTDAVIQSTRPYDRVTNHERA